MIPILLCPSAPAISWKAGLGVASRSKRIFKDRLGFSVSGFAIVPVVEADETLRSPAARPGTGKGGSFIVDHDASWAPKDRKGAFATVHAYFDNFTVTKL